MFNVGDLTRVVATYELPEIETPDDSVFGSLRFVVQVLRLPSGLFVPRVFRKDHVVVVPAYYDPRDGLLEKQTVEILVEDTSFDWESLESNSENGVLESAFSSLKKTLNL
jgi:hypothetical protein